MMVLPASHESPWYAFRMRRNRSEGDAASFSHQWTQRQFVNPAKFRKETNSFRLLLWNNLVDAWVSDVLTVRAQVSTNVPGGGGGTAFEPVEIEPFEVLAKSRAG